MTTHPQRNERYVALKEAAVLAGLSENHLARLCRRGVVACRPDGAFWRVGEASLVSFLVGRNEEKEARKRRLKGKPVRSFDLEPSFVPFDSIHKVGALVVSAALVFMIFPSSVEEVLISANRAMPYLAASVASLPVARLYPFLEDAARATRSFVDNMFSREVTEGGNMIIWARPARAPGGFSP